MTRCWRVPGLIATLTTVALVALPGLAQAGSDSKDDPRVTLSGPVEIASGETVDDVVSFDGPVTVDGRVNGDVVAFNGPVRINGTVTGDVISFGGRTVLGSRAEVNGDLVYADEKPVVPESATVGGEVQRISADQFNAPLAGVITQLALWLAFTISTLVIGLLLLWLAPRAAEAAHLSLRDATGATIGWGVLFFFGLPILAVVALVTLVGIPLGIAVLAALFPLYALSYTTGAFLVGRLVIKPERGGRFVAFFAGWTILRVVALVPFLGGLAWLVATVVGLGALLVALWRARQAGPAAASPAAA